MFASLRGWRGTNKEATDCDICNWLFASILMLGPKLSHSEDQLYITLLPVNFHYELVMVRITALLQQAIR